MKQAKTANELVEGLTEWLSELWPDLTGYAHALPEPSSDRTIDRSPLFVVSASSGKYGAGESSVSILIGVQVSSTARDPIKNYAYACKWLRDKIDKLGQVLYDRPLICGCSPKSPISWLIPASQPRPVWQAQISIEFTLPGASRDNAGFLI